MRSHFLECPRSWLLGSLLSLKSPGTNVHLHAGKAWAEGLEIARRCFYELKMPARESVATGLNALIQSYGDFEAPSHGSGNAKSLDRMIEAFSYYFTCFPLETDPVQPYTPPGGKPMIEFSFTLPLADDLLHPETGEPILYTGRADMVGTYAGAVSVYDDKTTSALGASWANQWLLRAQFTGYCWAARQFNIPVTQVVIRGIAILKTQFNHAQVITHRSDHLVDEWHFQIQRDIRRAISCWKEGYYDANLSDSCSGFGSCAFLQPCQSNNPVPWLTGGNYAVRAWNPVTREETTGDIENVKCYF
jgi:hypothetical protein